MYVWIRRGGEGCVRVEYTRTHTPIQDCSGGGASDYAGGGSSDNFSGYDGLGKWWYLAPAVQASHLVRL